LLLLLVLEGRGGQAEGCEEAVFGEDGDGVDHEEGEVGDGAEAEEGHLGGRGGERDGFELWS